MSVLFIHKLQQKKTTLSYEFFPPKTEQGLLNFENTVAKVALQNPDFISLTYGALGSTRRRSLDLIKKIHLNYSFDCVAHLTGLGHSTSEIDEILDFYEEINLQHILALRGDPPKKQQNIHTSFHYAIDLIRHIQKRKFTLGCACYPEVHTEAISAKSDLEFLKQKQDLGAKYAITQLFFHNDDFFRFQENAQKTGITIPIIAGIMPTTKQEQLEKFASFGTKINQELKTALEKSSNPAQTGVEWSTQQCVELIQNKVSGLHFYTLNQDKASIQITQNLKDLGLLST